MEIAETAGDEHADNADAVDTADSSDRPSKILAVLATVLAVVSLLGVWVRTQALDTDEWVRLSSEILDEEEVREKLAAYIVDQLYERIDVADDLGERLPEPLDGVANTLVGALRGTVTDGVERLLESDAVQSTWTEVNRTAHSALVAILRDETRPGISTAGGEVALELREILIVVGERLGFSGDRLEALPEDAGRIVIFESDELDTVQQTVRILDFLSWFLFVTVVVLYVVSVAISRDRLSALRRAGLALAGAGVFVLLVRSIAVNRLVDAVVQDPANEGLADVVAVNVTSLIRQMAWSAVLWGALIALFAWLVGDDRRAVWVRRGIAPAFRASTTAVVGLTVLFLMVLLWWDPGRAFAGFLRAAVTIALVIGAVVALRRTVLADSVTGTADADSAIGT